MKSLGFNYNLHVDDVLLFNDIGNPLDDRTDMRKAVLAQAKVVLEEAKELYEAAEAFSNGDDSKEVMLELVDGFVDVSVTNIGIGRLLKHMEYDLNYAVMAVGENNMEKFPSSLYTAHNSIAALQAKEPENSFHIQSSDLGAPYVLKDKNGKIRKPLGFKSVDLSPALPPIYKERT